MWEYRFYRFYMWFSMFGVSLNLGAAIMGTIIYLAGSPLHWVTIACLIAALLGASLVDYFRREAKRCKQQLVPE